MYQFLTRPGCHLCDEARPLVAAAVARAGGLLSEIDIDSDDDLVKVFGIRIPVLLDPEGQVLAEGVIDDRSLRRELKRAGRSDPV